MKSTEELDAQDRLDGEREGMRVGTSFGMEVGKRALLKELLWSRFKSVPWEIEKRVASATVEEIERWSDRFVSLLSVESVFGE